MRLRNLEHRVFLGLVLATTVFFLWMVRGFLLPVFWAAVFAVLFQPFYLRLLDAVRGRRSVAALISTFAVVGVVLIPLALLLGAVARQGFWLYEQIASGRIDLTGAISFVERSSPALADLLERYGVDIERIRTAVESAAVAVTRYIAGQALSVGQNALTIAVLFGLMLYLLFFFFRDGDHITRQLIRALPMGDVREQRLFGKFAEVSRATVKGTLVVAVVQGALGGVLFAIAGIPAATFWGVVMGVLSLLPAVGSALVWLPAAIILIASGSLWQGVLLILGGVFVIGLVDNLLRPMLIGRETKMPDYLILVATLGGLTVFGLAGFVAGPIIAALFLVMWEMFAEEYAPFDSTRPPATPAAPAPMDGTAAPVAAEALPSWRSGGWRAVRAAKRFRG